MLNQPPIMITPDLDLLRWLALSGGATISSKSEEIATLTSETIYLRGLNAQPWVMVASLQFVAVIGGQVAYSLLAGPNDLSGWPESGVMIPVNLIGNEIAVTVLNGSAQSCLVNIVFCSLSDEAYGTLSNLLKTRPMGAS